MLYKGGAKGTEKLNAFISARAQPFLAMIPIELFSVHFPSSLHALWF
jgi:hypothetical protein